MLSSSSLLRRSHSLFRSSTRNFASKTSKKSTQPPPKAPYVDPPPNPKVRAIIALSGMMGMGLLFYSASFPKGVNNDKNKILSLNDVIAGDSGKEVKRKTTPTPTPAPTPSTTSKIPLYNPLNDKIFPQNTMLKRLNTSSPTLPVSPSSIDSNTIVLLYFTASWCNPCRSFTPILVDFYNTINKGHATKKVEIILIPCEEDDVEIAQYVKTYAMPFLTPCASSSSGEEHEFSRLEVTEILNQVKRSHAIWAGGRDRSILGTSGRRAGGIPSLVVMSRKLGKGVRYDGRDDVMRGMQKVGGWEEMVMYWERDVENAENVENAEV